MSNRQLARGTLASGLVSVLKIFVQFVTLPLMARLVGPADYGLFGLAMPTVAFILLLADSGFGISLAREPESNVDIWSSAIWFLLGSGIVLAGIVIVCSLIQAPLINQPQLPHIMVVLALCPVLLALSVPANARLTRQARLGIGSALELTASLAAAGTAITLGLWGAGVWSLVFQVVVYWLSKAILLNAASPFFPRFRFLLKDLHPHLRVGGLILGGNLLDTGGRTVEASLVSHFLGTSFLGAFTFANQLPKFLTEAVSNSLWALLYAFAIRTNDNASVQRAHHLVLRVFALGVFPVVVIISVLARPIVEIVLGPRWDSAIEILQILLVSQALNCLGGMSCAILYAAGKAAIPFRITIEGVILRVLVVAAIPWIGPFGVAAGLGIIDIYLGCRGVWTTSNFLGVQPANVLSSVATPALASAAAGALCWGLAYAQFNPFGFDTFGTVVAYVFAGGLLYALLIALFEGRRILGEALTIYRLVRG